jgi:hypothetical protein
MIDQLIHFRIDNEMRGIERGRWRGKKKNCATSNMIIIGDK